MARFGIVALAIAAAGLTAASALPESAPAAPALADAATIGVDEVVAGMKGYGESVFVGAGTERFEVEVLGVLREFAPGTSYILARLTGKNLEKTGVVAGMSGSPVWLDGKLAGAVAFGWSFSQEAVAGITPIAAMRGIERAAPWGRNAGTPKVALADLLDRKLPQDLFAQLALPLTAPLGRAAGIDGSIGRPGAIAWGASGFSERALSTLGRALPMMAPAALGRTAASAELVGGSSVAAVLLDGDLRLAATGTVTERNGDRILAFGHPLFGLGEVSMPMASAEIVTVLGSNLSSFKLSNVGPVVGAFQRDHAAGNFGRLGVVARTIPLSISVASPEPRRFEMRMAAIPEFEGLLAAIASLGAVDTVTASAGAGAIDLSLVADLGADGKLSMRQSFDGDGAATQAVLFTLGLVDFVARNDLASVEIERLDIELVPHDEPRVDELLSAHALKPRLAPGESTELLVELRNWRGALERRRLEVTVPADTPDGRFVVLVGDGTRIDSARFALEPPAPRTFEQARRLIASLGSASELSLLAIAPGRSALAGGEIHARLPPSLSAVLGSAGGGRAIRGAIAARETHPQARPLSGLVRVDLEVERSLPQSGEAVGAGKSREKAERGGA